MNQQHVGLRHCFFISSPPILVLCSARSCSNVAKKATLARVRENLPRKVRGMTDDEAQAVQTRIKDFLNDEGGRGLDVGNPSHLVLLSDQARPGLATVAEDELRMVAAACWLGPPAASIPPTALRENLLGLLRQHVPDEQARVARVMEFVIAYGCGKWREVQAGGGGWEHRWQGAMRGLVRALEPAVAQANRWLAEHVVGFPRDRGSSRMKDFPEDTAVWSDAWMLATRLIGPEHLFHVEENDSLAITCQHDRTECASSAQDYQQIILPGAKAVWTIQEGMGVLSLPSHQSLTLDNGTTVFLVARDEDVLIKTVGNGHGQQIRLFADEDATLQGPITLAIWECTCGTTHCPERHRLHRWNPVQLVRKTVTEESHEQKEERSMTLWDFVASAVKGPQLQIQTGSFVQGLYFPLLAQEDCAP